MPKPDRADATPTAATEPRRRTVTKKITVPSERVGAPRASEYRTTACRLDRRLALDICLAAVPRGRTPLATGMLAVVVIAELRRARDRWLTRATAQLRSAEDVRSAFLWGSLARGTGDDWSGVDLIVVVEDPSISDFVSRLGRRESRFGRTLLAAEMPQNGVEGGGYVSATYIEGGLPSKGSQTVFP